MAKELSSDGFKPVERIEGRADAGVLLLCDHASNALPQSYGTLGMAPADLGAHIGYDIGAADLTRRLAARLGAPALLTRFSRLLIDPNRGAKDPTLVMRLSDRRLIPGNARIDAAEIDRRRAPLLAALSCGYRRHDCQALGARSDPGGDFHPHIYARLARHGAALASRASSGTTIRVYRIR